MKSSRAVLLIAVALLLATLFAVSAVAQTLTLKPKIGPPTTAVNVRGLAFGPSEPVDIFFDTTDLAVATTTPGGAFLVKINVPSSAVPGRHWVTAKGQQSGLKAQLSFGVQTNWPQLHYDAARTGYNPFENLLGPSNVHGLSLKGIYAGGAFGSSPAVVRGVLYSASGSALHALYASSGAELWQYLPDFGIFSPSTVADDIVYTGDLYADFDVCFNQLFALKATTGELLWSSDYYGDPRSCPGGITPAVAKGMIFFDTGSDYDRQCFLFALDARTGAERWRYPTSCGGYARAVAGDAVYYGSGDGNFYAGYVPAVAGDTVYYGSGDGNFYALHTGTGGLLWQTTPDGAPSVAGSVVYLGGDAVYALNATTGASLWKYATDSPVNSTPAVASGVIFAGSSDGTLYALNSSDGTLLWKYKADANIYTAPTVANGVVYIGSEDGNLHALNASTGELLWEYPAGNSASSSLVVANGVLYQNVDGSGVYVFGLAGDEADKVSASAATSRSKVSET